MNYSLFGDDIPGVLELLNEVALSRGKRFRPQLLLTLAGALGLENSVAEPYAVAAERLHNATLLHDDVIDESSIRRGKPTLNASGDNKKAVLGGDILLARTLRDLGLTKHFGIVSDLFEVLVQLTEGEWMQLEARGQLDISERHLREVARKKTSSLIAWCCSTPGRLADLDDDAVSFLREFGEHLGTAFQMFDDCLDFSTESGKPYSQDLHEGQINFVIQNLLEKNLALRREVAIFFRSDQHLPHSISWKNELLRSQSAILEKAEIELVLAGTQLKKAGLSDLAINQVSKNIISPFHSQVKKCLSNLYGAV